MTDTHPAPALNPWRVAGWTLVGTLLALPAIAMQFTTEVNWTALDFVFAATVFGSIGLVLEIVFRRATSPAYRAATAVALLAMLLLVWITAAVGIIGSEQDDANMLYAGVLLVALVGGIASRCRAAGLARTMVAAAMAQVAVPVGVAAAGLAPPDQVWAREVVALTAILATLWLTAAALYGRAAR